MCLDTSITPLLRLSTSRALAIFALSARGWECRSSPKLWRPSNVPGVFPKRTDESHNNLRRVLTRRFSKAIIYEPLEDRVFIWAIAHTSREPGYWEGRLKK